MPDKIKIVSFLVFLIFLLVVNSASAATITVSPGESIQTKCINSANQGDICNVNAGTYNERISVNKNGITIQSNGRVATRAVSVSGNNNTIRGLTISDSSSNYGIYTTGSNNLLEDNNISRTGQDGIWFFGNGNTYRGNFIHDLFDPSRSGDPHVDCLQTWGDVDGALFENNTCDHTRTSGSNQIVMLENLGGVRENPNNIVRNITFKNNLFVMHDAGYSPMNFHRKAGQGIISNIQVLNNTIVNTTGSGQAAVNMIDITNGIIQGNQVYGYGVVATITGGTVSQSANLLKPISEYRPGLTISPTQPPNSPTLTGNPNPGDVNGDNLVNIFDFQILSNSFGSSFGQSNYNSGADLNNDNTVNIIDFQILSNNFGR